MRQCTCADLFSVRRIRRRSCTTATGHGIAPCFPLPFLHCNALSAFSPPLCGQISLAIFCEPSLSRILVGITTRWNMGSRSSLPPGCIFLLARSLREKCNLVSQIGGPRRIGMFCQHLCKNLTSIMHAQDMYPRKLYSHVNVLHLLCQRLR